MMNHSIRFKTTCETKQVLAKVKENRAAHVAMVREATEGYLRDARRALERKLAQIVEGRVVSLQFQIPMPQDYTSVYDTAIGMLTSHQEAVVVLEADEYRNLMEDQWDWTAQFARVNAAYSSATRHWSLGKGFDATFEG